MAKPKCKLDKLLNYSMSPDNIMSSVLKFIGEPKNISQPEEDFQENTLLKDLRTA